MIDLFVGFSLLVILAKELYQPIKKLYLEEQTMSTIKDYLLPAESFEETKEVKVGRYPRPFVIRTLTQAENDALKKKHTHLVRNKKTGVKAPQTDYEKYMDAMVVQCVVTPDFNDAELQAYYGTNGDAAAAMKTMLLAGEYSALQEAALDFNGFNDDHMEDLKEEAKND